jgi:hypothetical protein
MMPLYASDFDQSRYIRAADLGPTGSEKRLKIKACTRETVGEKEEAKACVWFTTHTKGLLLNKTNLRTLQGALGDNMDGWAGRIIILFVTPVSNRGAMVDGVRLRIPPPKDDHRAPTAPAPKPPPVEEPDDDFDDEVSDLG